MVAFGLVYTVVKAVGILAVNHWWILLDRGVLINLLCHRLLLSRMLRGHRSREQSAVTSEQTFSSSPRSRNLAKMTPCWLLFLAVSPLHNAV